MKLYPTLESTLDPQLNHKMIVHGIHGEKKVIPLRLINFVCMLVHGRSDYRYAHEHTDFPIKEAILNRYGKKLTEDQYSALLTLIFHVNRNDTGVIGPRDLVIYKQSNELKYSDEVKAAFEQEKYIAEAVYNLGFDTGELSIEHVTWDVTTQLVKFMVTLYVNDMPEDMMYKSENPELDEILPFEE